MYSLAVLLLVPVLSDALVLPLSEPRLMSFRASAGGSALYMTEYNWWQGPNDLFSQSANPGAYFKVGHTAELNITVDQTAVPTTPYMTLKWRVDDQPWLTQQLPVAGGNIQLATNDSSNTPHTTTVFIENSVQSADRWQGPASRVRITNILSDGFFFPPTLQPKRMLVYWDSIGEGVRDLGSTSGGDLTDNDSTASWVMALAAALSAEVSFVAFGGQGYVTGGNGNVPPLFTPGNDTLSAWDKFDVRHSRLNGSGVLDPVPDYIFCGHGTNDANADPAAVAASAFGWLTAMRQAAPGSSIFMVVPFGGFCRATLQNAFQKYQSTTPDKLAFFLDLGTDAQAGLTAVVNGGTDCSADGLHPLVYRDGQLGAMLAAQATIAMLNAPK